MPQPIRRFRWLILGGLTIALVGVVLAIISAPSANVAGDTLLTEDDLREIALDEARFYGLEGEPEIIFSGFVPAREWGPAMRHYRLVASPQAIVYVLSIKGEFDWRKSSLLCRDAPDLDQTQCVPEQLTFGVLANTGALFHLTGESFDNIESMTTERDYRTRASIERQLANGEIRLTDDPVSFPMPTYPYPVPETILEPPPDAPGKRNGN